MEERSVLALTQEQVTVIGDQTERQRHYVRQTARVDAWERRIGVLMREQPTEEHLRRSEDALELWSTGKHETD